MAIDGVKIIDSDDGYDIYNFITESYKDGNNVEHIIASILKDEENYCINEFYAEIYWTSLAYSLWKIGYLTEDIKNRALEIIQKGANEFWLEIDSKAQVQRQKVLDKLAVQLQSDNPKPLKVPKAKTKRTPHFDNGDVLAVKFEEQYGVVFVSLVDESPRKIEYHLACTRLLQKSKPNMADFLNSETAYGKNNTSYALKTDCWFNHKDLGLILDQFEKIGHVELEQYELWVLSPANTLDDIYEKITRDVEIWGLKLNATCDLVKSYEEIEESKC